MLDPKCGLYLDKPISVGDFASLYPSSMLSENLCPSSKVWAKIYDLAGNLLQEHGETDKDNNYIYDNLNEYEKINWVMLSKNPNPEALELLIANRDKIHWDFLNANPSIFEAVLE